MIEFTDYDTGKPVFVRPEFIVALVPCPAQVFEGPGEGPAREHGERMRIDMSTGVSIVVKETAEEIRKLMED